MPDLAARTSARMTGGGDAIPVRDVSVFYPEINNASVDDVADALRKAGATILHTTIAWSLVEPRPGEFDFSAFARPFEVLREQGFKFIVALDSSGRPIVPPSRVVDPAAFTIARPAWIVEVCSDQVLARDRDGTVYPEFDYSEASHQPHLHAFYRRTLDFLEAAVGDGLYGVVPGVTSELEVKYGQLGYRWRSYGDSARRGFQEFQAQASHSPLAEPPMAEFNNRLDNFQPSVVSGFADWQDYREEALVRYIEPLCRLIRGRGYRTIGYFGQFLTQHDAIYAAGVVRRGAELFDIASFDYNYFNGHDRVRDPWIVPAMVSLGRSLGYGRIKIGLYVERFRDFATNALDWSVTDVLRDTLDRIDDGPDVVSLEIGGIETADLPIMRATGLVVRDSSAFDLGGALPVADGDAVRIAIVAAFDNHYLWHGDFSNERDHLSDLLTATYRILRLSKRFRPTLISERQLQSADDIAERFDIVFLPHVLAMDDDLVDRLRELSGKGVLLAQDVGAGGFDRDGVQRPLADMALFGIGAIEWMTGDGAFEKDGLPVTIAASENVYFTYVRLAPLDGCTIRMREVGGAGAGLIAETDHALTFGFLPQLLEKGYGRQFWATLFRETIEDFVLRNRSPRRDVAV